MIYTFRPNNRDIMAFKLEELSDVCFLHESALIITTIQGSKHVDIKEEDVEGVRQSVEKLIEIWRKLENG